MKTTFCITLLAALALSLPAQARIHRDVKDLKLEDARQRLTDAGIEVQEFLGTSVGNNVGTLIGFKSVSFVTENLYLGGAGYGGSFTGGPLSDPTLSSDGFGYGGLITGWQDRITDSVSYDAAFLLGAGGTSQGWSLVTEPRIGVSQNLGKGLHAAVDVGFLGMPGLTGASGFVVGVRLDFKRFTLSFPE